MPQILKVKTNILILTRKNGKQNKTLTANENNFQTEMAKKIPRKIFHFFLPTEKVKNQNSSKQINSNI